MENKKSRLQLFETRLIALASMILFPLMILTVIFLLARLNYVPNTWFSGNDNLNPEINYSLNWGRIFDGGWQEYQALGFGGIMAYVSDLPHMIIIQIINIFIPTHDIRYAYLFLCLIIGTLGMYFLFKWLIAKINWRYRYKEFFLTPNQTNAVSFLTAMFFVFNLGTLQNFYGQIELFPTQWAFFPWLILYFLKCLKQKKRKNYLIFALLNLCAAPMAYTPTIFIVYFFVLILLAVGRIARVIKNKKKLKKVLKKLGFILGIVLLVNSFWIFSFIYSNINGASSTVISAKINQMSSNDAFELNRAKGGIADVSTLSGFWMDYISYDSSAQKNLPMMQDWQNHLYDHKFIVLGFVAFGIVVIGVVYSFILKIKYRYSFFSILLISFFVLSTSNPPFGFIFDFLRNHIPILKEALRFPFTKFSPIATLIYSIYFGFGVMGIYRLSKRYLTKNVLFIEAICILVGLFIYMLPMFQGHLVDKSFQFKIPDEYFSMMSWFNDQPSNPRVVVFPQSTFWETTSYHWGYSGSGFLWYGIKQPLMDRAFDVWNSKNEQFYNEISKAIYSKDINGISTIFKKYNTGWFIYDKSIVVNESESKFYTSSLIPAINENSNFKLEKQFGENLIVYSYTPVLASLSNVTSITNPKTVGPEFTNSQFDSANNGGDYVTSKSNQINYLIRDSSDLAKNIVTQSDLEYDTSLTQDGILILPEYFKTQNSIPANIYSKKENNNLIIKVEYILPQIYTGNTKIFPTKDYFETFTLPVNYYFVGLHNNYVRVTPDSNEFKLDGSLSMGQNDGLNVFSIDQKQIIDLSNRFQSQDTQNCAPQAKGAVFTKTNVEGGLEISGSYAKPCVNVNISNAVSNDVNHLVNLSYTYQSLSNAQLPEYCMYSGQANGCLNESDYLNASTSAQLALTHSKLLDITKQDNSNLILTFALNATTLANQKIQYRNINLTYYPLIKVLNLKKDLSAPQIKVNKGNYTVKYPILEGFAGGEVDLKNMSLHQSKNCNIFQQGRVGKMYISDKREIIYSSVNADSCDSILLPGYSHNNDYILSTNSRNIDSGPLKLCVNPNGFDRCIINELSNSSSSYEWRNVFIPDSSALINTTGFTLGIDNMSYGNFIAANAISSIRFQQFPLSYLMRIKQITDTPNLSNSLTVISYQKNTSYFYSATINGAGVLNLKQSFENGWITIGISGSHVLVNNWSNGWIIDTKGENVTIAILYWPQLLQFAGLIFMASTITFLIYNIITKRFTI